MAQQNRLTLNTLVQGAWAILLARISGEEEVVFGTTVSGRPSELIGVERMIGMFINTLPARLNVGAVRDVGAVREPPLLGWLQQLQQEQIEREQYSYTPLVEV